MTHAARLMNLLAERGVVSAREANDRGIPRVVLSRLTAAGEIERVGRGLYALPDAPIGEAQSIAEAHLAVPGSVVCLLTALHWHGLTDQNPTSVWLAVERGRRAPTRDHPPIESVWMSPDSFSYGVAPVEASGITVEMTNPAKSVADAYKYRARIGQPVAVDALREYVRQRSGTLAELWQAAKVCRVTSIVSSHVEALVP